MSPFPMSPTLSGHSPTPPNLVHGHPAGNMWSDHHLNNTGVVGVGHQGLLTTAPHHHSVHGMDHGYNMYSTGMNHSSV